MHELSITQSILDIAEKVSKEHDVKRVKEVRIKLGQYSGVVVQTVQEFFDIISRGTVVEGAKLDFQMLPLVVHCNDCGGENEIDKRHVRCPQCGGTDLKIIQGREFYVESLEVD